MYHLLLRAKDSPLDWTISGNFESLDEANKSADEWRRGSTDNIYMVASSYYIDRINGVKEK